MQSQASRYPDISDILAAKAAWRRERAALSFAEKLAAVDELKKRVEPIVQARELRKMRQRREAPPRA
jgi:hypothetical protein